MNGDARSPHPEVEQLPEVLALTLDQYLGPPTSWLHRKQVIDHAEHPINFYEQQLEVMQLTPQDTIVDVGCSAGDQLVDFRRPTETRPAFLGRIVGLDIDDYAFSATARNNEQLEWPIEFAVLPMERLGDNRALDCLGLKQGEVSAVFANQCLFYAKYPVATLVAIHKLLKPGGYLATSTNAPGNLPTIAGWYERITKHPDVITKYGEDLLPPPTHSSRYSLAFAEFIQPKMFEVVKVIPHETSFIISSDEPEAVQQEKILLLQEHLTSKRQDFRRRVGEHKYEHVTVNGGLWRQLLDEVVETDIRARIAAHGFFEEPIRRMGWVLCKNSPLYKVL